VFGLYYFTHKSNESNIVIQGNLFRVTDVK